MRLLTTSLLCLALATGCSAGTPVAGSAAPAVTRPSPDPSAGAAIEGVTSYPYTPPKHEARDVDHDQRPPAFGTHWPPRAEGVVGWLTCGVFDREVPDEFAVHSLEHGAVWLTYGPGGGAAPLSQLAALRPDYVLVSSYPGQSGAYGATAYDHQLFVDDPTDPRLAQFVRDFAGGAQGNEPGAPCTGGSTPQQAQAALDRVSGTTSASTSRR